MSGVERHSYAPQPKAESGWSRVVKWLGWTALALLTLQLSSATPVGSRGFQTCVVCRASRFDYNYFGLRWSNDYQTLCSRWYTANLEASHKHLWEPSSCRSLLSPVGVRVGFACRMEVCPVVELPEGSQLAFYKHHRSPNTKALFIQLANPKFSDQSIPGCGAKQGRLMVRAILAWEAEGYPGTWEKWWASFLASRLEHP